MKFLVAVGRLPNSDSLHLEKIGMSGIKESYLTMKVTTNLSSIYAIGECEWVKFSQFNTRSWREERPL